jgi:hypothetical protein
MCGVLHQQRKIMQRRSFLRRSIGAISFLIASSALSMQTANASGVAKTSKSKVGALAEDQPDSETSDSPKPKHFKKSDKEKPGKKAAKPPKHDKTVAVKKKPSGSAETPVLTAS